MLLNTDLHVVQDNHRRMTRQKFVRHTLETVCRLTHGQEPAAVRFRDMFPISESILSALSTASNVPSFWPRRSYSWRSIGSGVDESKIDDKAEPSMRPHKAWLIELEDLLKVSETKKEGSHITETHTRTHAHLAGPLYIDTCPTN